MCTRQSFQLHLSANMSCEKCGEPPEIHETCDVSQQDDVFSNLRQSRAIGSNLSIPHRPRARSMRIAQPIQTAPKGDHRALKFFRRSSGKEKEMDGPLTRVVTDSRNLTKHKMEVF